MIFFIELEQFELTFSIVNCEDFDGLKSNQIDFL